MLLKSIANYCYLSLCLTYKLNFIVGVYIEKTVCIKLVNILHFRHLLSLGMHCPGLGGVPVYLI